MTQYRNAPLEHAIRYPLFERVDGDLHEQRLVRLGESGEWLDPSVRVALLQPAEARVRQQYVALTPLIVDQQQVAVTRPRYMSLDPIVPTGAYHVEAVRHQFAYNGEQLPPTAAAEAILYHGGNSIHAGGEPVAAVKFNPGQATQLDPYQQAVVLDPSTRQWLGPSQPEHMALMKGYTDLLGQLVFDPDRGL